MARRRRGMKIRGGGGMKGMRGVRGMPKLRGLIRRMRGL